MKKILFIILLISKTIFANTGEIHFVKGKTNLIRSNKTIKISKESVPFKLKLNDIIKTENKSFVILKFKNDRSSKILKLGSNSELKIDFEKNSIELGLNKGSTFIQFLKSKLRSNSSNSDKLFIKVKNVSMGVRGTQFFITHANDKSNDVWMCVKEGIVEVKEKNGPKSTDVTEGKGILIKKGDQITSPRPYKWISKLDWNMQTKENYEIPFHMLKYDLLDAEYD